ncbi:MAG: hypothetical protein KIT13_05770 [Burkholderiales bacterium]|nr:hypothetical protein [Burkholderiales bacterium]
MRTVHALLGFSLAISGLDAPAQGQDTVVEVYNNTAVDICVERKAPSGCQEILSRQSALAPIRNVQWIRFGKKTFRYHIPKNRFMPNLKLQAESDGKLYFVPPETALPASALPRQPAGFPLEPTRRVDLT